MHSALKVHRRIRRLIRPTPRPTKPVMTNRSKRGWPVMTPTKELTQPTEAVTREVTAEIISAIKTPPYSLMRRLIKPTPSPTKATMTKSRIKGLPVIAPTKEPTQDTLAETREPISEMIAATEPTAGVDVKTPHFQKYFTNG